MKLVRATSERLMISVAREDLIGINNAVNEICNGIEIEDPEFETRLGQPRNALRRSLQSIDAALSGPIEEMDLVGVWSDGSSVQVRAISVFGDPVDMGSDEANAFATQILDCAREADKS